jgi:microcystin-dependent protein
VSKVTIGQISSGTYIANADYMEIEQSGVSKKIEASFVMPTGATIPFAGASAPSGWLICDGAQYNRITHANLYGVIGTTWGTGDGSTTFNVPDLRESVPIGIGTYASVQGAIRTASTSSALAAHDAFSLAQYKDDQGQGHAHQQVGHTAGGAVTGIIATGSLNAALFGMDNTNVPTSDGVNGTPRTGTVTRAKSVGMNYIIKY